MGKLRSLSEQRRKNNNRLLVGVNQLLARGSALDTFAQRDKKASKRYATAKRQYDQIVSQCEQLLTLLKKHPDQLEAEFKHITTFEKMSEENEQQRQQWEDKQREAEEKRTILGR